MDFSYILKKIFDAPITNHPFQHLHINGLFKPEDFEQIVSSIDIKLARCTNDENLFNELFRSNYRIIEFPGATTDKDEYVKWHKTKRSVQKTNTACEGFGTVLRLTSQVTDIIRSLQNFLISDAFISCISSRFNIDNESCTYDAGIQKYLDGYEISPHPDNRRKALTYMVNVNTDPNSHNNAHHTSYLRFKNEFSYVKEFWVGNEKFERCWVPWEWCDIRKQQVENNSMVIFSPSNDTMHAVKADYDHLVHQRTQLYGNLWYKETNVESMPSWEELSLPFNIRSKDTRLVDGTKRFIADRVKKLIKKDVKSDGATHVGRNF